jgi:hypothetical protein
VKGEVCARQRDRGGKGEGARKRRVGKEEGRGDGREGGREGHTMGEGGGMGERRLEEKARRNPWGWTRIE